MMNNINQAPLFFLGANAPGGFVSHFSDAYDPTDGWRTYIIKGGPGTGKSSLMKKAAAALMEKGQELYLAPCSSDPQSLDAVVFPKLKTCIMDGTAPHVVEPKYPGMCEMLVNLGDCYDADRLMKNAPQLLQVFRDNAALHARAGRYISAASSLLSDSYRIALDCTDTAKAAKFGLSLARRALPAGHGGKGHEQIRFLSGITPMGLVFYGSTLEKLCDKLYILEDEHGASSRIILSVVRAAALDAGLDIISCPCPFAPGEKLEHILIPALRTGFCTSNRYLRFDNAERKIHARRFTDAAALRQKKQRLSFNRKAVYELLAGTADTLMQAKVVHDQIEKYYIEAMDFAAVDRCADSLIKAIVKSAGEKGLL